MSPARVQGSLRFDSRRVVGEQIHLRTGHLQMYACEFRSCDFSGSNVKDSFVPGHSTMRSSFIDCSFDDSRLALAPAGAARFERCSFRGSRLRQWFWGEVDLIECDFSGATIDGNIRGASLPIGGRGIRLNEIFGNDFATADVRDVGFQGGVTLSRQQLPRGAGYVFVPDAETTLLEIRAETVRWGDLTLRRSILQFVEQYQFYLDGGQREILFHPEGFGKRERADARVFAELLLAHGGRSTSVH